MTTAIAAATPTEEIIVTVNNTNDYIESQKALESLGAIHIGNICSGQDVGKDVVIPYQTYKDNCDRLGIPAEFLVPEKSPLVAFGRAWRAVKKPKGMKASELKHTRNEDSPVLLVAFYKESSAGSNIIDAEIEIQHEITLSFNKENFSVECIPKSSEYKEDAERLIDEIAVNYKKFSNIVSNDVQTMSADFCRTKGISLQPRGGTYFIPKKHDSLVQAFQDLYSEIGESSNFVAIPSYSSPGGNASLGKTAMKSLLGDLDELDLEVFQMTLSTPRCENLRNMITRAIAEIKDKDKLVEYLTKFGVKACSALKREANQLIKNHPVMGNSEIIDVLNGLYSKLEIRETFRDSTLSKRIKDIKELSTKIMDFQDYLGDETSKLTDTLSHLNDYVGAIYSVKHGGIIAPEEELHKEFDKLVDQADEKEDTNVVETELPTEPKTSITPKPADLPGEDIDEVGF